MAVRLLAVGLTRGAAGDPLNAQVHDALEAQQHLVSEEAAELFWRLRQWPLRLAQGLEDAALRMAGYRGDFRQQLARDQGELGQALAQLQVRDVDHSWRGAASAGLPARGWLAPLTSSPVVYHPARPQAELQAFAEQGDIAQAEERLVVVQDMSARLGQLSQLAQLYAAREEVFGLAQRTEHPLLEQLQRRLEPYVTLWQAAAELGRALPSWMDGPLADLAANTVAADCDR
jgi:hypothetical protein